MAAVNVTQDVMRTMCYNALVADQALAGSGNLGVFTATLPNAPAASTVTITSGKRLKADDRRSVPAICVLNGAYPDSERGEGVRTIAIVIEGRTFTEDQSSADTTAFPWTTRQTAFADALRNTIRAYFITKNFPVAATSVEYRVDEKHGLSYTTLQVLWRVPVFRNSTTQIQIDTSSGYTDAVTIPTDQKPIVRGMDIMRQVLRYGTVTYDSGTNTYTGGEGSSHKDARYIYVTFEMAKVPTTPYSPGTALWGTSTYPMVAITMFPAYDAVSGSYVAGDFCTYSNVYYRCIGTTSGVFDGSKWKAAFDRVRTTTELVHADATPELWHLTEEWYFTDLNWIPDPTT